MRIQDVMTRHIVNISPDTSVAAAREQLRLNGVHHLLVIRKKDLVGVVSHRDLADADDSLPVSDVMTRNVVTIAPTATIRQAAGVLDGRNVGCLPVVRDGTVEGLVETSDVLRVVAKGAVHVPVSAERYTLRRRQPKRRGAGV